MISGQHAETVMIARPVALHSSSLSGTRLWSSGFLSPEERHLLAEPAQAKKTVRANLDLVREGEDGDNLYVITEGWACRYATTKEGERSFSAVLLPGDVANLDSLLFDRLDYSVRTLTPAVIVTLPRRRVLALAEQHPGIARTLTWLGLIENAILSKWALSLGRRSAAERLAHLICELSLRLGVENGDTSCFTCPITQEHIADALGLTSVHVNRMMHHLRSEGLIVRESRTITIPQVRRLRRFAGFDPRYLHLPSYAESLVA